MKHSTRNLGVGEGFRLPMRVLGRTGDVQGILKSPQRQADRLGEKDPGCT